MAQLGSLAVVLMVVLMAGSARRGTWTRHPDMTGYGFWNAGNVFHMAMAAFCIIGTLVLAGQN